MSIFSVGDIIKPDWGLEDGILDKIIKNEKLEDVTQNFSGIIKTITEKFNATTRLRIISFDEKSGVNSDSNELFRSFILARRNIFYHALLSNRECCVILINGDMDQLIEKVCRSLPHEYAHHYQITDANFPYYIPKNQPPETLPPFVHPIRIGPEYGSSFIDGSPLGDLCTIIFDSNERMSDIICEGLLRERGMTNGLLERFMGDIKNLEDRTLHIPDNIPHLKKYIKRLAIRDSAEWGATVYLACQGSDEARKIISQHKKLVLKMNKKFTEASKVYDEIHKLCIETDFNLFREPKEFINYTKQVMNLLKIRIRTSEKW